MEKVIDGSIVIVDKANITNGGVDALMRIDVVTEGCDVSVNFT